MSALIVGGDRINTYRNFLLAQGFGSVLHWTGRNGSECHRTIPTGTRLVVILVDQVNHGFATRMRKAADKLDLPIVFSRRSIGQLDQVISRFKDTASARLALQ